MPNKNFSIYPSNSEDAVEANHQLLLEVASSHIACLLLQEKSKSIIAFELFTFEKSEAENFEVLFSSVSKSSMLINKSYTKIQVFVNNDLSVMVPIFKFNKEIAEDYLNVVFGEDKGAKILFEPVAVEAGMMNAYRVDKKCYDVLNSMFPNVAFRHTWSKVIKNIEANSPRSFQELIYVLFYDSYIIVTVVKDEKVNLIQSFIYNTPDDVLYYLLNITDQFMLSRNLSVQISGMINLDFKIYREIIKYFRSVTVEHINTPHLSLDIKEYPSHYFAPFFNLAT